MRLAARAVIAASFVAFSDASAQAPVRALTFNIRYGTANDGAHRWPNRREHVIATIRDHAPHILGLQEALRGQLDELARALPQYRELGVGRDDGKAAGEYAALLVDTTRFAVIANGHFWYSDTPEIPGSKSWGNNITRICTWARVADRVTRDTIRIYNTHWDHESQPSREKSAALLLSRIATDGVRDDRVLVLADFNSDEENAAFKALTGDDRIPLFDTFRAANPDAMEVGTFHGFHGDSSGGKIDAILASPGWMTIEASIDRRKFGELWASDHFAVSALLRASPRPHAIVDFAAIEPGAFPDGARAIRAFADFERDGDWDVLVGSGTSTRLFERLASGFGDVTRHTLSPMAPVTIAWGNFTHSPLPPLDRHPDFAVGVRAGERESSVRLFHNRGSDQRLQPELRWLGFEDVTAKANFGALRGEIRQLAWADFDGDGDLDLTAVFANRELALLRSSPHADGPGGVRFEDVANGLGLAVMNGANVASWFDADQDGDLDLLAGGVVGNPNVLFRNNRTDFSRLPRDPLAWMGREEGDRDHATRAICVGEVTGDDVLDVFLANHGRNALLEGRGAGNFSEIAQERGVAHAGRFESCAFGDFDNDGRTDLFVTGTSADAQTSRGYLLRNTGERFIDVTPPALAAVTGLTGGAWMDFDRDGDVDLILTSGAANSAVFENRLPENPAARSVSVRVRDIQDFMNVTGAEVRVYASRGQRLIATAVVESGSSGGVQHDAPLHLGVGDAAEVDIEVTYARRGTRVQMRLQSIAVEAYRGRVVTVRIPAEAGR